MPAGGLINTDLRLVRLSPDARGNYFVDCSRQGSVWGYWNSPSIQTPFHYSCRLRHARPGHFLLDAGARRIASFSTGFLSFLMQHAPILASGWELFSPISHTFREFPAGLFRSA